MSTRSSSSRRGPAGCGGSARQAAGSDAATGQGGDGAISTLRREQNDAATGSRPRLFAIRCSAFALPLLVPITALSGCGPRQGSILYFLGVGQGAKVEARFRLTRRPVLILIDDPSQRVDWPAATNDLFDELAQELLRNKAAVKIVPRETIERLRQSLPDFDSLGAREIGEAAQAEQVVWIQVGDFLAEPQIPDALVAAYFSVAVKVLNALEKQQRARVRLWPTNPRGELVAVTLTGSEVAIAKTKDGIAKKLAEKLAVAVAKLFYDHRLGDFERSP